MTQILDGKATSLAIEAELTDAVQARLEKGLKRPHLAAVLVGDNPASRAYVGHKVKACARVGFESTLVEKPTSITQSELLEVVRDLNQNPDVDGFIVQLPLPDHIDDQEVLEAVPFFGTLYDTFTNAVARPSAPTGGAYGRVSNAFFSTSHDVLSGTKDGAQAVADLEGELLRLKRRNW